MLAHPSPLHLVLRCSTLLGTFIAATTFCSASARAQDDRYQLQISGQEIAPGHSGQVKLSLTADEPWHMNTDFPTSVKLSPVAGITIDEPTLKRGDARVLSEHKIVFIFDITAQRSGNYRVPGKIKFAICKNDSCSPASASFNLRILSPATEATKPQSRKRAEPKGKPKTSRKPKTRRGSRAKPGSKAPPATNAPKLALSTLAGSPWALRYLDQWMLDPIWGPGLSGQLHQLLRY